MYIYLLDTYKTFSREVVLIFKIFTSFTEKWVCGAHRIVILDVVIP